MPTPSASASPSPGPGSDIGTSQASRHSKNALDKQRMQLERLLKDPSKPAYIPPPPKEKTIRPPREMMKNVQGSSAGAGSGEFHVYKAARRREYERLKLMEEQTQKETSVREFEMKKRQWEEEAEAKTAKNRAKRQKKKEKAKAKVSAGANNSGAAVSGKTGDEAGGQGRATQTSDNVPLKKRRLVNGDEIVFRKPGEEGDEESDGDDEPGPLLADAVQTTSEPDHAQVEDELRPAAETAKIVIHEED